MRTLYASVGDLTFIFAALFEQKARSCLCGLRKCFECAEIYCRLGTPSFIYLGRDMLSPFPLVLMYFTFCQAEDSLKRESGSKVQHANIQASKVVFILLATRFQFDFQVILFVFFF